MSRTDILRRGREPVGLHPFGTYSLRHQKRKFQRLAGIEARIAGRLVAIVQVDLLDRLGAAEALGHILARQFEMYAAGMGSFGAMHGEKRAHFLEDAIERTRLESRLQLDGVAVHRIAGPNHALSFALHGADERGQLVGDLVRAEARDQRETAGLVLRIEYRDQLEQFVFGKTWSALQPDRIFDAAHEFDMRAVELSRAIADPEHVGGSVV